MPSGRLRDVPLCMTIGSLVIVALRLLILSATVHNVHHTRECTNRVGEKGTARIHDVCGQHMFYFVEVNN